MANDPQAGLVELSLYLLLRAPGPRPNVHELEEAAHQAGQTGAPRDRRRGADAGHARAGRAVALDAAARGRRGAQDAALRDGARGRHDAR